MKRILSALLAGALAAAVLVCPALAADAAPWVQISGRSVSIQDVPERCSGIQLTLTLDKEAPSSFSFNSAVSSGDAHAVCTAAGKELTLYVTSKGLLGQNGSVALGSLADSGFTVKSVSGLKLIGMDSAGFGSGGTVTYDSVEVKSVSGQGGSSSGPGGSWGGGSSGGGVARYPVGTAAGSGGALQISSTHAAQGETVTVTATPDAGWLLSSLTVTGSGGQGVSAASLGGGKWSFTMPGCAVTVSAAFSPAQGSLPFNDVGQDDWFREAVAYVYGAGLMNGTDPARFGPEDTTTRGMIVTILHRYEGAPGAGASSFRDVAPDAYYAVPVAWAAGSGVVNGVEPELFGPEQLITREQMAAILYRYAQHKGMDVSRKADLSAYADAGQVSAYAGDAMAWAVGTGLIAGVDSRTLQPGGSATRAQVATILMRFCRLA